MAKALKCDRCGGFYDLLKGIREYRIEESCHRTVDLCPDCYDKFLNFLDEIKNQDLIGTGELYPGEFESRHYEFEDCDNIKGERVIKCQESR